jgi:hypothetical protein
MTSEAFGSPEELGDIALLGVSLLLAHFAIRHPRGISAKLFLTSNFF